MRRLLAFTMCLIFGHRKTAEFWRCGRCTQWFFPAEAQGIEARSGETVKQGSTHRAKARSRSDAPKTSR